MPPSFPCRINTRLRKPYQSQNEYNAILQNTLAFTAVVAFVSANAWSQSTPPDWENPRLTGVNNLPPHATMVVCPDAKTALTIGAGVERRAREVARSTARSTATGNTTTRRTTLARVPDFWKPGFDDSIGPTIPVPSNVEMHGLRHPDLREHPVSVAASREADPAVRAGG